MKLWRLSLRLVVLSLVAAAFVGLTAMYGNSARILPYPRFPFSPYSPSAQEQVEMRHQRSAPDFGYVTDFFGWGIWLAVCAFVGRKAFRLRLNPRPRGEGQPILLGLRQGPLKPSPAAARHPPLAG